MYTVIVRGLEFYGFHGVSDEEQAVGHRYKIDLEVEVEGSATATDNVADSVDYGRLCEVALEVGRQERCRTVERLANLIGERVLQDFAKARVLTITLVKKLPPAPVIAEEAGVVVRIERG